MNTAAQRKPRNMTAIPDVYFDRPDWDATFHEFATDVRSGVEDLEIWEMKLRSSERKSVELEFVGAASVPQEYAVYLLDEQGGTSQDLRTNGRYALQPGSKITPLKVLVGNPSEVARRAHEIVPREYALDQNYPNPFNPTTTIPVSIPRQSWIELAVYNILGQKIRTLHSGAMTSGRYYVQWDGKNDGGGSVASGMYVYRLTADGTRNLHGKMILAR